MWSWLFEVITEEFIAVHWSIFISVHTPYQHSCNLNTLHLCWDLLSSEVHLINQTWEFYHLISWKGPRAETDTFVMQNTISNNKKPFICLWLNPEVHRVLEYSKASYTDRDEWDAYLDHTKEWDQDIYYFIHWLYVYL